LSAACGLETRGDSTKADKSLGSLRAYAMAERGIQIKDSFIYRLLEQPWLYRLCQGVLAAGQERYITDGVRQLLTELPPAGQVLDVGCGPASWLWKVDMRPVGLDFSLPCATAYAQSGNFGVAGSAAALPFRTAAFDSVWSFGLLHHLPNDMARLAVMEMMRVCRPTGYVVVFDAVLPESAWDRPLAYMLRRADRGKFVRRQNEFKRILPAYDSFTIRRFTFTYTGLEALLCWSPGGTVQSGAV
jgi:SAM-dependent methyltransferase